MRNITRPQQFNMTFLSSIWSLISAAHFSYLTLSFHHSLSVLLSRSRQFCMMKFLNMKSFIKLLLVSSLKLFYEFTLTCHWLWNKAYPRGGLWARNITPQTQIKPPSSCRERVRWCSEGGCWTAISTDLCVHDHSPPDLHLFLLVVDVGFSFH